MSALELHNGSLRFLIFASRIVGAEIWTPGKHLTPASYSIMVQIVIYFYCNFWTVYKYRNDFIQVLKILNCAGIAFQLSVKFFVAVERKEQLLALFKRVENELYDQYKTRSEPEGETLYLYAKRYALTLRFLIFMYVSTLFVFALYPLYIYVYDGQLIPLFMFEVPYVDWHTTTGYIVTNVVQVVTYLMGVCGLILADGLFIFYVVHGLIYMEIFKIHMKQLDGSLQCYDAAEHKMQVEDLWKQCLQEHQKIAEYFKDLEGFSGLFCLILVFTGVFAICDNLVLSALTDWYASYLFLLVCFVQLTIYFAIGNIVELKVESMDLSITHFPWNLFEINNQKQYMFVVRRMQNPFVLTVYGFSALNFESYMAILKVLYQFAMVIFNFVS